MERICRRKWGMKYLFAVLFVLFLETAFAWRRPASDQKILLSEVDILTVYSDRTTQYRRTKPFPQLTCVGGDAMKYGYRVEAMQCKNMGGSYGDNEDVQWSCTAQVPDEFKLGRTEVVCEGYSSPDDPYILKGSCAVEYTLHLTRKGREVYLSQGVKNPSSNLPTSPITVSFSDTFTSFFLFKIFRWIQGIITAFILITFENPILLLGSIWLTYLVVRYSARWLFSRIRRAQTQPRLPRSFWSGFFGGGGNDPPGPPPPYTRHPPPSSYKTYQVPPETRGWTPGFWTGLAGGAAAGYGLGSRRSATETSQERYGTRSRTENSAPRSSGWVGGGSSSWSNYSSPSGWESDDNGNSGGMYTSAGFGGTRRR